MVFFGATRLCLAYSITYFYDYYYECATADEFSWRSVKFAMIMQMVAGWAVVRDHSLCLRKES